MGRRQVLALKVDEADALAPKDVPALVIGFGDLKVNGGCPTMLIIETGAGIENAQAYADEAAYAVWAEQMHGDGAPGMRP